MRPCSDTLLVWTGASCVCGCRACPIDQGAAPAGVAVADLLRGLLDVPERDGRLVVLLGGEPLLRPDAARLLGAIRAAGCVPGIVTTGRPLVYQQVRERLRRAGVEYLRIQLFGVGAAHDRATATPGAFEQAVTGLRSWVDESGAACDVDVALTVRGRSLDTLPAEVEALNGAIASTRSQIVVAIDPADGATSIDPAPLQRAVAALSSWNEDVDRPLLAFEGISHAASAPPLLTIPPLRAAFVAGTPAACCLGPVPFLARTAMTGDGRTCANSFNFVRTTTSVPWSADAAACTAYSAAGDHAPSRSLWLIDRDRLVLCATDTGDFDGAQIARVKDEWSHVFLDRAPAGVLDDISEGMRRLMPDPTCDTCAQRTRCGRRYQVIDGPPFARQETWIANYVAGLRGRVLDVGCGEQLYRDALGPLVRSGTVQYTGLDPDEPSLAVIRAALPEGRFHLTGIEDYRDQPASYDHVLCLRSLNHVRDVDEALARMASLLKPGGQLLIVECTPFAMLRGAEQVRAADRAPRAGHQHFRNVASDEVLPFARRRSLDVIEHQPAGLHSTNEWILLLQRRRDAA
jgi:2-polyprenyl-3-methyl-5-hydroxy-6-metoxy-1,4-benzoquinol methylase